MKNVILTCLLTFTVISFSFGQLKVIAPNGDVGIGVTTPTAKLQVNGITKVMPSDGGAADAKLELGAGRSANGKSIIDMYPVATTGGDWVARFQSLVNGQGKGVSTFSHNGTGNFLIKTLDPASDIFFQTSTAAGSFSRLTVKADGKVGIGSNSPAAKLYVNNGNANLPTAMRSDGLTTWDVPSDFNLKNILGEYDKGIDAIMELRPVIYKYKGNGGIEDTESERVGLIAQEYQKISPKSVKPFVYTELTETDGSYKVGATEEYLSINTSDITFMLVNAVKQQQQVIKSLEEKVEDMAKVGYAVPTASDHVHYSTVVLNGQDEKAMLAQNAPNPFTKNTKIDYFVPSNSRAASMSFTDITGKEVKRINIDHTGLGTLDVSIADMPIGIYSYSLVIDGSTIASKKMVLSK